MFLIRLIRYLSGYVTFTCRNGFPERFINLCSLNGISLWDVRNTGGILTAKTSVKCYKNIRPCVKKSGMKIKIKSKTGFPFFIKPYLERKGIFAGILVSTALIILLCSCVWTIDVTGNENFTENQIILIAENYGIYPGALKRNIDAKKIKTDIKSDIRGISWFSVNINGGNVSLELTESGGSNEIIDIETPCNIVSGIDGEILQIVAHAGTPATKTGNAVTKGDLLISGIIEKTDGSSEFIHARGTAVIRTNKNISVNIPHNTVVKKVGEIKKTYTLKIFGLSIPLSLKNVSDISFSRNHMLGFRNTTLPVGIMTTNNISLLRDTSGITENKALLLAFYTAFSKEKVLMKNSETEAKTVKTDNINNSAKVCIDYINHETTGIENYLELTQ